jgi:hypothetical protein
MIKKTTTIMPEVTRNYQMGRDCHMTTRFGARSRLGALIQRISRVNHVSGSHGPLSVPTWHAVDGRPLGLALGHLLVDFPHRQ